MVAKHKNNHLNQLKKEGLHDPLFFWGGFNENNF